MTSQMECWKCGRRWPDKPGGWGQHFDGCPHCGHRYWSQDGLPSRSTNATMAEPLVESTTEVAERAARDETPECNQRAR